MGLRRAEAAFRNFETPLLFRHIRGPMKINELRNRRIFSKKTLQIPS
jgi:hypothetical protein